MGGSTFQAEERFRKGVGYWHFDCPKLGPDQCKLATSVDCGVWRLPANDATTGDAEYTEWAAGPRNFDDVKVTFLMNNKTQGLYQLAKDLGNGKNNSANRFNFTLQFKNVDGSGYFRIDYTDAAIVNYTPPNFNTTAHGEAATEGITFKANTAKVSKG